MRRFQITTREQLLLAKSREKPEHSNKDPTQPKINFFFFQKREAGKHLHEGFEWLKDRKELSSPFHGTICRSLLTPLTEVR